MEEPKPETLENIFDAGLTLHDKVIDTEEDSNSKVVQTMVKKAILMLEDATRLVSVLDIFSRNENYKEIPTEHLKYFLLPVLLGDLANKVTDTDRAEVVETVQVYYIDYLQRCKDYGLSNLVIIPSLIRVTDDEEKENAPALSGRPDMSKMNAERNSKMERYKQTRQLESDIKDMRTMLARERDEDVTRQFYLKLIQKYINVSLDEMCSLEMEVGVLRHMAKVKAGKVEPDKKTDAPPTRLQPIIITKDKLQKEVYGMGYPSLPVLSVDEFYEKRVADGWWKPPPATGTALQDRAKDADLEARMMEQEEREKDDKIDRDDDEALAKARSWDDWTDDHRRGEGNRKNMG